MELSRYLQYKPRVSSHGRVLSAPNFYCCNFNGRAVPWVLRSSLSVCKSRVESRAQCVTNGAENSTSTLAKN